MPICNKCDKSFPNLLFIDGKQRNLCNRKYCIECSPFGAHNTRNFDTPRFEDREIQCERCSKFYIFRRHKGMTTRHCSGCKTTLRRNAVKRKCLDYKGGKCCICSYDKCASALSFHHLDPTQKDFNLSDNYHKAWKVLELELDKCILVCQNHHAEIHEGITKIPEKYLAP